MRVGKRTKQKLKYAPRFGDNQRSGVIYYKDYCCKGCYFDWGRWFEKRHMYQHDAAQSNYEGILKKYWVYPNNYREQDLYPINDDTETSI